MRAHYEATQKIETKCDSCGGVSEHDVEIEVRVNGLSVSTRTFRNEQNLPVGHARAPHKEHPRFLYIPKR